MALIYIDREYFTRFAFKMFFFFFNFIFHLCCRTFAAHMCLEYEVAAIVFIIIMHITLCDGFFVIYKRRVGIPMYDDEEHKTY